MTYYFCENYTNSFVLFDCDCEIDGSTMSTMPQNLFVKLRGRENFDQWKISAQSYLVIKGLWKFIETTLASDASTDDQNSDLKAKSELTLLIEPHNYTYVADRTTAKECWDALSEAFEDSGTTRKVALLQQLVSNKLDHYDSMEQYVNKTLLLSIKVKKVGFNLDDEILGSLLLGGLTPDYRPMIMGLENSGKKLTIDYVKNILLQEIEEKQSESALVTKQKFVRNNKSKKDKSLKSVKCYNCNMTGHISKNCPKKTKDKNSDAVLLSSSAFLVNSTSIDNDWFFDSAATSNMTKNKTWLKNICVSKTSEIITANNGTMSVDCVGEVAEKIIVAREEKDITIKNVQYVPDIVANLLSVGQIVKNDNVVVFHKNGCEVYDSSRKVIATGSVMNNMFKLDKARSSNSLIEKEQACVNIATRTKSMNNAILLHRRLGHASFSNDIFLKTFGQKVKDLKCVTCIKGKQTRLPFPHSVNRATRILELIHSDVCGPMSVNSIGGKKYFVTFIDDFSRKCFVYVISQKNQVFRCFKDFKLLVEGQMELKIKTLRTDNGGEYLNNDFKRFLIDNGIVHQTSTAYTPQQNGLAERMNRTIVEKVRCMLIDAALTLGFWAEAVQTAVFVINNIICKGNDNKTPEELWSGKQGNISMLRVFGCRAMTHIPKQKRKKLDVKSIECIYLGSAEDMKAYRLYNKSTKKIIISRDVVFFEGNEVISEDNGSEYYFVPSCHEMVVDDMAVPNMDQSGEPMEQPGANSTVIEILDDTIMNTSTSTESTLETSDTTFDDTQNDPTYKPKVDLNNIPPRSPSTRERFRTFDLNRDNAHFAFLTTDPLTVKEALEGDESENWKSAILEEYNSLLQNKTWTLTKLPPGRKAIRCKWVFKTKTDHLGNSERHKARLVAKGYAQRAGIDYSETYSPVVRYSTIRYLMSIAAQHDLDIHQMDVETAFLQGDLHDEIYMVQPELFSDDSDMVCKLEKPIYGLKQASREWNKKLKSTLKAAGLTQSRIDPCVYLKMKNGKMFFIAIYVDDLMIFDNDEQLRNEIKSKLMEKFKMKDLGIAEYCIGLHITRDRRNGTVSLDQTGYINTILQKFDMETCNPVATPMDVSIKLIKEMSPKTEAEIEEMASIPYQEAVGSILYLAQGSRPDIAYAVSAVSRYNNNPGKAHWIAVKRILRYLKGTKDQKLTFSFKGKNEIIGFCDADWANDEDERRSCTGYVFLKNGAAISWFSKRQPTIALSSTEAEYMALSSCAQELLWFRQLEKEIWNNNIPTLVHCDNQSAIRLAVNDIYQPRTKHIDVRHHFVREMLEQNKLQIEHIPTAEMVADIMTKPLPKCKHNFCTTQMGLRK